MIFIASDAILLVEDDRILRLLTVGLREEASYWVLYADSAEKAWGEGRREIVKHGSSVVQLPTRVPTRHAREP